MEIRTNRGDLNKVLGYAMRAIPNKTSTPILENFLFVLKDKVLAVTASDMDVTIVAKTSCEGVDGSAVIPARTILELVKTLPSSSEVTIKEENGVVTVDWGKGNSNFPSFDVKDYPEIKKVDVEKTVMSADQLKSGLKHVLPNVSDDTMRPAMMGVYFDAVGEQTNLVATDAHTLAIYPVKGELSRSFILPFKAATFLKDNIANDVSLAVGENSVVFELDGIEVYSRTIIGKFPKYQDVLPKNNGCILEGSLADFKGVINRVSSCANKASKYIKLTLDMVSVTVDGKDTGFNCSAHETLEDFSYNGEKIEIGFKYDLLLNLLSAFDGEKLIMKFADSRRAALVEVEGDPCQAIIMPIMVQ